ncbi:ComF family protein [Rothia sp. ZJ932]|uniref:ComF family protein n=1 Tax=Rothia sp. ZJ932 TaxID=2810516 RepID=UPI001967B8DE|nr:phosphoribosyltransferase family protein [Rothia sp. ZJ932]QRZ61021.1 ComF family protein [Rothia sp. ZJ932]
MNHRFDPLIATARESAYRLRDVVLPTPCASCQKPDARYEGRCQRCDFLVRQSLLNLHLPFLRYELENAVAAGVYEHELARCILAFKNEGRYDQRTLLATGLARAIQAIVDSYGKQQAMLVPVPSSARNTRRRGFSPALELASAARRQLALEGIETVCADVLEVSRTRSGSSGQKELGVHQRYARLHGAMRKRWNPGELLGFETTLEGAECIICDDVVTTGASMLETARVLEDEGARVLGFASVAAVARRKSAESD